jgi:hypothetical protein
MKKSISISELRSIIREVLEEAPSTASTNDDKNVEVDPGGPNSIRGNEKLGGKSPTIPAPETAPTIKPSAPPPRSTVGARDLNHVMKRLDRGTIPAKASNAERAMSQELKAKGMTKGGSPKTAPVDPNRIPFDKNPNATKAALVHKSLVSQGVQSDIDAIQSWIAQMDPADSLIKTADDLASEWMAGTS